MRDSMLANQFNKVSLLSEYLPNISQDIEKRSIFRLGSRIMFFVWIEEHNLYSHDFKVWILETST